MEIKDKPKSMSVREWITKKIAIGAIIPEKIIREVITHQFDSASEALKTNNSLEISGFGKFYYNVKKADKEIEHCKKQKAAYEECLREEVSEAKRVQATERHAQVVLKLEKLYKKKRETNGED